jgi:DNA-directed RNA polymerase specialized sigma24 family protein
MDFSEDSDAMKIQEDLLAEHVEQVLLSLEAHIRSCLGPDYGPWDLRDKVLQRVRKLSATPTEVCVDARDVAVQVISHERRNINRRSYHFDDTVTLETLADRHSLDFAKRLEVESVAKEMIALAPRETKTIIEYLAGLREDELDQTEIANLLGLRVNTVHKRMERYRRKFRLAFLAALFRQ